VWEGWGCEVSPYRVESFHVAGFTGSLDHIESLLFGIFKGKKFIYVGHTDKGVTRGNNKDSCDGNWQI